MPTCHIMVYFFNQIRKRLSGLPSWLSWERIQLQCRRPAFDPWVGKMLWRREGLPTPVFWPGEFHGLCSPWGHKESDPTEDFLSFPFLESLFCSIWAISPSLYPNHSASGACLIVWNKTWSGRASSPTLSFFFSGVYSLFMTFSVSTLILEIPFQIPQTPVHSFITTTLNPWIHF